MSTNAAPDRMLRTGLHLSRGGLALALVAAAVAAAAGPCFRYGLVGFDHAVTMLAVGAGIGVVASLFGVVGANLVRRAGRYRDFLIGWVGVLIGAGTFTGVYSLYQKSHEVPPIHDVTTDPANPPAYVALLPEREASPNGAGYDAALNVPLQLQAYADLNRVVVAGRDVAQVFDIAVAVARAQGWRIAAADPAAGRIEAVATSRWWGLKDDIVIRIVRTAEGNARVDLRSASRVGENDLGANAEHIRAYLADLRGRLGLPGGGPAK